MKKILLTGLVNLFFSTATWANCWEECIVPNPFGGCAKKVKVCDLENPEKAIKSSLRDLSPPYVKKTLEDIASTPAIANAARSINISENDLLPMTAFLYYGAACVASNGTAPAVPAGPGAVSCAGNSCACAAVAAGILVYAHQDEILGRDKDQGESIVNSPSFIAAAESLKDPRVADSTIVGMNLGPIQWSSNGLINNMYCTLLFRRLLTTGRATLA